MKFFNKLRKQVRPMLTCEQVNDFIMDYMEGRLSDETKSKFETHLKKCVKCTPYLEQYKKTIELVAEDGQIEVPPDLVEHTLSFLRQNLPNFRE